MCCTTVPGELTYLTGTRLEMYRFGRLARTSFVNLGGGTETVMVDATHWDLSRSRQELFAEDGWLTILENLQASSQLMGDRGLWRNG